MSMSEAGLKSLASEDSFAAPPDAIAAQALSAPHASLGVTVPTPDAPVAPPSAPSSPSAQARGSNPLAPRPASVTAEQFIREAIDIIEAARPMPLSTSVMINRDELVTLLESALAAVPDETRQARWLLREREEVLARARVDANMVIDEARSRVAQMVQRTEVVRTAERRARQLIDDARIQTSRRRHEVDEYCERQLAQFAGAVDQIQIAVQAARRKLAKRAATPVAPASPSVPPEHLGSHTQGGPQQGGPAQSGPATEPIAERAEVRQADTRPVVFDQDRT